MARLGSLYAQCGNFMIFLSLRFYVKSILGHSRSAKSAILTHLEVLNFDFSEFLHFLKAEMYQNHNFRAFKIAKIAFF